MTSFADNIFTQTTTATVVNTSVTVLAINTSLALEGRDLISATEVINVTFTDLAERGLIISDGVLNGAKTVTLTANDSASALVGTAVNVSYTYNPDGYISDAGGRSISKLILVISALAIVVFVIVVMFKFGSINQLINSRRKE
ncbi:MAG TPA: hypothetical protein ENI29_14825 [bacterium]|nr:hypothetical protein [bacterium]